MSALDALTLVLSAPLVLSSRILHSSFFRSPVSSLSRVSPSRPPCPSCDPSGRGSSRFLAQQRIPYDGDPRVPSRAPTENWKRPIGPRGHDKKGYAPRAIRTGPQNMPIRRGSTPERQCSISSGIYAPRSLVDHVNHWIHHRQPFAPERFAPSRALIPSSLAVNQFLFSSPPCSSKRSVLQRKNPEVQMTKTVNKDVKCLSVKGKSRRI